MARFVHTALPDPTRHIRLLEFNTIPSSPHSLSVSSWSLEDLPEYTAVSYTWGPVETVAISVNGHSLRVRTNCYNVLRQAATHSRTNYLWIDSICIDQEGNVAEKNAQVSMMYKIYRKAAEVLVCVGENADSSDRLMTIISAIEPLLKTIANNGSMWRARSLWRSLFAQLGEDEGNALLQMLEAFDTRPYFRRLWIIQELYAGRGNLRLVCGDNVIPHSLFQCFLTAFDFGNPQFHLDDNDSLSYLTNTSLQLSVRPNMKSVFIRFGPQHLCFDPRDRLFGLQSFLDKKTSDLPLVKVDYSKSRLDLALELMPHYDSDEQRAMLAAFELTARSKEIERLVSTAANDPCERSRTKQMTLSDHDGGSRRIRANHRGELEADFNRYREDTGLPRHQQGRKEDVEMAFSRTEMYFQGLQPDRVPRKVWCGSEVAALVDARTEVGDLIVAFGEGAVGELNSLLVLRNVPENQDSFVIVGQGIANFSQGMESALGVEPCCCDPTDQRRHSRFTANYELSLSVEEVMAYVAQDFVGPKYYHWAFDFEKRLERLVRCPLPTFNVSRTVQMKVTHCFAHESTNETQSSDEEAEFQNPSDARLGQDIPQEASDAEDSMYDSMASSSDDSSSSEEAGLSLTERYRAWQVKKFGQKTRLQDLRDRYEQIQAKRRQNVSGEADC
ncbi:hypothetical protein CKM354_001055900 [Cercospora kikuchii]|uniref:Heterokaryon incompatibility domain-containing protein n=1 Tax=Cercospora kikuchii TaxID=84275 RepID=A0A9P3CMW9_9PEZI|nr:uncharacterized protein CKM354_001055900 [Cercospora kikuchii]GIZ47469.1 hypothetical protein CKM354_001055900 [Cercospora kikuchii]